MSHEDKLVHAIELIAALFGRFIPAPLLRVSLSRLGSHRLHNMPLLCKEAACPDSPARNMPEPFGDSLLHVDPNYVWSVPGDTWWGVGGMRKALIRMLSMHIASVLKAHINGRHAKRSVDLLVRTACNPAVQFVPPPFVSPAQFWKGRPFVSILKLPRKRAQSVPFLLTFSSPLLGGGDSLTDSSHQVLSTWAAFVVGMPKSCTLREGDIKLVW